MKEPHGYIIEDSYGKAWGLYPTRAEAEVRKSKLAEDPYQRSRGLFIWPVRFTWWGGYTKRL